MEREEMSVEMPEPGGKAPAVLAALVVGAACALYAYLPYSGYVVAGQRALTDAGLASWSVTSLSSDVLPTLDEVFGEQGLSAQLEQTASEAEAEAAATAAAFDGVDDATPTYDAAPTYDSTSSTDSQYILPSDTQLLTRDDISWMGQWETELAINELYARYGYPFGNADIRAYFDSKAWYTPVEGMYDPPFTDIELANRDLLVSYAKEHGWR